MKQLTYSEWNNKGYYIIKGSKAVGFADVGIYEGEPLFTEDQVEEAGVSNWEDNYYSEYENISKEEKRNIAQHSEELFLKICDYFGGEWSEGYYGMASERVHLREKGYRV